MILFRQTAPVAAPAHTKRLDELAQALQAAAPFSRSTVCSLFRFHVKELEGRARRAGAAMGSLHLPSLDGGLLHLIALPFVPLARLLGS